MKYNTNNIWLLLYPFILLAILSCKCQLYKPDIIWPINRSNLIGTWASDTIYIFDSICVNKYDNWNFMMCRTFTFTDSIVFSQSYYYNICNPFNNYSHCSAATIWDTSLSWFIEDSLIGFQYGIQHSLYFYPSIVYDQVYPASTLFNEFWGTQIVLNRMDRYLDWYVYVRFHYKRL